MKVLFIGPNLGAGGAERQWSILLPGLRRLGYDARLIALDGGGPFAESLQRGGVPLEIMNMRHQADIRPLLRSAALRKFVPDAVVSRGVSGLYIGLAVAQFRHARHIFNEHRQVGLPLSRRREAMVRLIGRRVDLVVAVTAEQAGMWLDRGYPPDRVVVVPNGVEAPDMAESSASIRRELGLPESAVVAALVAGMRPEKRIPDFVRAVLRVREVHPELVGVVVGEGSERSAIETAARGDAGIRLLGQRGDVPRILKAADIFVLASEYEAAPMAILEAMAAGLPVIATATGGIDQMVQHGTTGLLVAPRAPEELASRLAELAGDAELRQVMGRAGARRHREAGGAEAMINGYARILGATDPLGGLRTDVDPGRSR
jgi:glycosyltransferase involved in cell wall biosynthesis